MFRMSPAAVVISALAVRVITANLVFLFALSVVYYSNIMSVSLL